MVSRLGRWCLPLGKWEKTCHPHSKGLLADADNSFWSNAPMNVDGNVVCFENTQEKHVKEQVSKDDENETVKKEDKKEGKKKEKTDEEILWIHRLLANYHG